MVFLQWSREFERAKKHLKQMSFQMVYGRVGRVIFLVFQPLKALYKTNQHPAIHTHTHTHIFTHYSQGFLSEVPTCSSGTRTLTYFHIHTLCVFYVFTLAAQIALWDKWSNWNLKLGLHWQTVLWASVSCLRTVAQSDKRSQESNHKPSARADSPLSVLSCIHKWIHCSVLIIFNQLSGQFTGF